MGFFDQLGDVAKNIGKSAGDFAKQVGDKTNDALEISKLNTKIAEIEKEKKKLSDALFERFARGEEVPEEVKEFCNNIKSHLLNIDGFKEEIEKVKAAAAERATNLKEEVNDKVDDLKDAASDVKDHAEDFAEDVKDAADNVVDEVKDHVEDAKDAVHDAVDNIKEDNN